MLPQNIFLLFLYLLAVFLLTTIRGMWIRRYAMKTYTRQLIKKIISAFLSPKLFYICHLHPGSIPFSASTLITVGDGGHLILELLTNPSVRWIKKRAGVGDNLLIGEKDDIGLFDFLLSSGAKAPISSWRKL